MYSIPAQGRKYFQLQQNWLGKGPAKARYFGNHPYDIHRIKVDEMHGLLIVTHEFGGLTVFDLDTTEILWQLDSVSVFLPRSHSVADNPYLGRDTSDVARTANTTTGTSSSIGSAQRKRYGDWTFYSMPQRSPA